MSALETMLAMSSPALIIYLVGMILAVVFWRRCPKASLLCLLGLGLLLLTTVMQLATHVPVGGLIPDMEEIIMLRIESDVIASGARAGATALLLGAIFSGRKPTRIAQHEMAR